MNRRRAIAQIGGAVGSVVIGAGCGGGRFSRKPTRQSDPGSTVSLTVSTKTPISGTELEIKIATNGILSKPLLVDLTSSSPVLRVPSQVLIPQAANSVTISRPVGDVVEKELITLTATTVNDKMSLDIVVMDSTKARAYEKYPQSANTIRVDWHPGLVEAGSYNIKKMTPGATVLSTGTLASMNFGGERSYTRVSENSTSYQMESGRKLDLRLEARYLGVNGAFSKSMTESRSYDESAYSFSVEHRVDKGMYAIEMPQDKYEALRAEYFKNDTLFENTYGTHYVSSVNLECYVRATYYLTKVSSTLAKTSGLEVSAKGGWKASSISVGRSMKDRLAMLSSGHSVSVAIETNVSNASLDKTITSPSDVDGVLSEVAKLQQQCAAAKPVVSAYNLSPWADLFLFDVPTDYLMGDQSVEITEDLFERERLLKQLDELTNNSVKYSYLGPEILNYYKNARNKVADEVTTLKNHLKALVDNPNVTSVNYTRNDLGIELHLLVPMVEYVPFNLSRVSLSSYYNLDGNYGQFSGIPGKRVDLFYSKIDFHFEVIGMNGDFTVQLRKNGTNTVYDPQSIELISKESGNRPSGYRRLYRWRRDFEGLVRNTPYKFESERGPVNTVNPLYKWDGRHMLSGVGYVLDFLDKQKRVFLTIPAPIE